LDFRNGIFVGCEFENNLKKISEKISEKIIDVDCEIIV